MFLRMAVSQHYTLLLQVLGRHNKDMGDALVLYSLAHPVSACGPVSSVCLWAGSGQWGGGGGGGAGGGL